MATRIIQYTTTPEAAEENRHLIRAVFAELAERSPAGLDSRCYRLDDDATFIHVVTVDGDDDPLSNIASFGVFMAGLGERTTRPVRPMSATVEGIYTAG